MVLTCFELDRKLKELKGLSDLKSKAFQILAILSNGFTKVRNVIQMGIFSEIFLINSPAAEAFAPRSP